MLIEIFRCLVTAVVSAGLLMFGDRFYPILHSGQRKYEAKEQIPKILTGKFIEVIGDAPDNNAFTMQVMADVKTFDGKDQPMLYPVFDRTGLSSALDKGFEYGFRINNHTNDGLVLNKIYTQGNDELDLAKANWGSRFIDANKSLVLRYGVRDCPKLITATFKKYQFTYALSLNSEYVEPCFSKVKKAKQKSQ